MYFSATRWVADPTTPPATRTDVSAMTASRRRESFRSGLTRVVQGAAKYRIALMCAEKEPLHCHRTLLVARALDEQGVDVAHIHADGGLEPHGEAMNRLLDIHKLPREGDLSGTREELIDMAIAQQAQRVAVHVDDKPAPRPPEHDS